MLLYFLFPCDLTSCWPDQSYISVFFLCRTHTNPTGLTLPEQDSGHVWEDNMKESDLVLFSPLILACSSGAAPRPPAQTVVALGSFQLCHCVNVSMWHSSRREQCSPQNLSHWLNPERNVHWEGSLCFHTSPLQFQNCKFQFEPRALKKPIFMKLTSCENSAGSQPDYKVWRKKHIFHGVFDSSSCLQVRTLGPLGSCDDVGSEQRVNMFMELVDGVFLHKIMTHMWVTTTVREALVFRSGHRRKFFIGIFARWSPEFMSELIHGFLHVSCRVQPHPGSLVSGFCNQMCRSNSNQVLKKFIGETVHYCSLLYTEPEVVQQI